MNLWFKKERIYFYLSSPTLFTQHFSYATSQFFPTRALRNISPPDFCNECNCRPHWRLELFRQNDFHLHNEQQPQLLLPIRWFTDDFHRQRPPDRRYCAIRQTFLPRRPPVYRTLPATIFPRHRPVPIRRDPAILASRQATSRKM